MRALGVDIGGTFTDTVLVDAGRIHAVKTATTSDLITGLVTGVQQACDHAGIAPSEIETVSHGSTVAVNALIEDTGAPTALITTEGFRDILEIGEGHRDASLLYDPCGDHQPPIIPRRHRYEVPERMNPDGTVQVPLDEASVDEVIDDIRDTAIDAVAICLLHAHRNPSHEEHIAVRLAERAPEIDVSTSSEVSPQIREYARSATTAVDAYLKPKVTDYLDRLDDDLHHLGIDAPINVMKSDGGLSGTAIAADRPVTQLVSGPAAGVTAAAYLADTLGRSELVSFDMGGTSCDTALITDGVPIQSLHRDVHGMKINGPFIDVTTIGAGGGSIARVDEVGALRVGPESAGAEPGPACYQRGGTRPTVTDADLVLGYLNPSNFAAGSIPLDPDRARDAIRDLVADPLEMTIRGAAAAIRDVIDAKMASAIRVISVDQGIDPREFALLGFGGAGPMHACDIALDLDLDTVLFPPAPGVNSAVGLLATDIRHEYTEALVTTADQLDPAATTQLVKGLIDAGHEDLRAEGVDAHDRSFRVSFDAMYAGQAHYLTVPLDGTELTPAALSALVDRFEASHDEQYGFTDEQNPVELINVRVTATGHLENPDLEQVAATAATAPSPKATRRVTRTGTTAVNASVYARPDLAPGHMVDGPAIIELDTSLIWIGPEFDATVHPTGTIEATREVPP